MTPTPLVFHLSHVRVELTAPLSTLEIAAAVWGGCPELVKPTVSDVYDVHENGRGGYEIRQNGELMTWTEYELDVVPRLEALLYERVHATRPEGTLFLHGAALLHDGRPLILVGPSGAGKSTLSLAAVRRGLGYLTDELIGTDGEQLWGMPRAIQFDAVGADAPRPPWLMDDIDFESFRIRRGDGSTGVVPLLRPRSAARSASTAGCRVVMIERAGVNEIARTESVEGVRALYEAAHHRPDWDLGTLISKESSYRLSWSDPTIAMDELLTIL